MSKKYGEFIKSGKSYLINTPYTPRQYTNVITNQDGYLAEISGWGTGAASLQFESGDINTIVDGDKKTLYCRDDESGEVWCPGVYPMMSKVEGFGCEHSDVYTQVTSEYRGIAVKWRIFIPQKGSHEIWSVDIENKSPRKRKISVVPAVRLLLTGFAARRFFDEQVQYSVCDFEESMNGMYFLAGNPNPKDKTYNAVLATSVPIKSYCGEGEKFLGAPLAFHFPEALLNGRDLGNHKGLAGEPFQGVQCQVEVEPSETSELDFIFGVVDSKDHAKEIVKLIKDRDTVEELFAKDCAEVAKRRDRLIVDTPNEQINYFVNLWLKKGLEYGMRKKDATRDNFQFAEGLCMSDPDRVRKEILRDLKWQYKDGHTLRSWVPLDTVHYCDGAMWLVITTCGYLKFSDDMDFLNIKVPYYDGGEGTVLEHLIAGIANIDENRGPHNLPLSFFADWNDALNYNDDQAESVFMAMGLAFAFNELAALMDYIDKKDEAEVYRKKHAE